jgi:hypothetical protein
MLCASMQAGWYKGHGHTCINAMLAGLIRGVYKDKAMLPALWCCYLCCCRNTWQARPHTVTFVVDKSTSKPAPQNWQWSSNSQRHRPLPRVFSVSHLVDEQGHNVTFAAKDAFVQGGGVIHTINAVRSARQDPVYTHASQLPVAALFHSGLH